MQLVRQALGNGDEAEPQVREVLVEQGDVGEIAGQAVEALGDDDLEGPIASVLQELLVTGRRVEAPLIAGSA